MNHLLMKSRTLSTIQSELLPLSLFFGWKLAENWMSFHIKRNYFPAFNQSFRGQKVSLDSALLHPGGLEIHKMQNMMYL